MKNKRGKCIIGILTILCICVIGYVFLELSAKKINILDLENGRYTSMLEDVCLVEMGNEEVSYSLVYEEDIERVVEIIKTIEIKEKPVSTETTRNRNKDSFICLAKENGTFLRLCMDKKQKMIWLDPGYNPSYTYKITNKKIVKALLNVLKPVNHKYLDARIKEVKEDYLLVQKDNTIYKVMVETKEKDKEQFRVNEKLRIFYEKEKDNVIEEVIHVYYLNELEVVTTSSGSSIYSEKKIENALNLYKDSINLEGNKYSYMCVYYDEKEADEFLSAKYGKYKKIENTIVVFAHSLYSRSLEGYLREKEMENVKSPRGYMLSDAHSIPNS